MRRYELVASASWWRSAVTVGCLFTVLSLSTGVGSASADSVFAPLVNSTCNYDQVVAALGAEAPDLASMLGMYPQAQTKLRQFLALPADQREQKIQQGLAANPQFEAKSGTPEGQQMIQEVTQVANTCQNY